MKQRRIGIGGWTYIPWRDNFYPAGLPHAHELEYASRQVTAIEINGTFYGAQKPASFAKWRDETPDDFIFSVKAVRYATNRKILAEAGPSIERFMASGLAELAHKLGPILWQFAPTKKFEAEDFEAFLKLLPNKLEGMSLRHVLDVRHPSFMTPDFLQLARKYKAATVFTDAEKYPSFADLTSDFVYARLMRSDAQVQTGYSSEALDAWAQRIQTWMSGADPDDLPRIEPSVSPIKPSKKSRDIFVFFINGAKERAPHAAHALLERFADSKPGIDAPDEVLRSVSQAG